MSAAVSRLIEEHGARQVLEAVGEYCAENLGLECSGGGFERAASTLRDGAVTP